MKGSRFDWSNFFISDKKTFIRNLVKEQRDQKGGSKRKLEHEAIPISRCLDSWFEEEPELISFAYNFFSDFVHPNLGSNLLLMGVSNDSLETGENSNKAIGKSICKEAIEILTPCLRTTFEQLANSVLLATLGDTIEKEATKH